MALVGAAGSGAEEGMALTLFSVFPAWIWSSKLPRPAAAGGGALGLGGPPGGGRADGGGALGAIGGAIGGASGAGGAMGGGPGAGGAEKGEGGPGEGGPKEGGAGEGGPGLKGGGPPPPGGIGGGLLEAVVGMAGGVGRGAICGGGEVIVGCLVNVA